MTKKHFIALAEAIRHELGKDMSVEVSVGTVVKVLSDFCQSQNGNFKRDVFEGYIQGTCGPNGGEVRQ